MKKKRLIILAVLLAFSPYVFCEWFDAFIENDTRNTVVSQSMSLKEINKSLKEINRSLKSIAFELRKRKK